MNYTKCFCDPTKELNPRVLQISNNQPMLRYIIMMYDPNSPLRKNYPELDLRKQVASQESGYDLQLQDGERSELEREVLVESIILYLRMINNLTWTEMCTTEEAIWEYNRRILEPIKSNDKEKDEMSAVKMKGTMMSELKMMNIRYKELTFEFFGEDDDLIEASKIKVSKISSEDIAKRLRNVS